MNTATLKNMIKRRSMKKWFMLIAFASALTLAAATNAWAQTLDEAASQAARQYNAKVLSAHTVQEGDKRVHVIRLLTKDGVVKTVRITVRNG
jgi:cell division protein YceG involved in septum cleavage